MTRIEELSAKYHAVMDDMQHSIAETQANLQKAQEKLSEATEAERAAVLSADAKAYALAKKRKAEASDQIELYEKRLEYIRNLPLISKAEYNSVIAEIQKEFDDKQAEVREKAFDLAEQLYEFHSDLAKVANSATELISFMFYDVCRETNALKMPQLPTDYTLTYTATPATAGFYEEHRGKVNKEDSFRLFFG